MMKKWLNPPLLPLPASVGVLILRIGTSLLMLRYGYGKLENYLAGDRSFADPFGWGEELSLVLTILAEVGCSLLLILGLGTRLVLIPLIFTMLVAFFVIHAGEPFDKQEHSLVFLIPYLTLVLTGPGRFSIDQRLFG